MNGWKNWIIIEKIKADKIASLDEIQCQVWKTSEFDDILLWLYNIMHKKANTIAN